MLAPFAAKPADSRGRLFAEPESATRTCYGRDRDRIIHSTAFRRLKHKTQVFVQHEGDYYRTRLTHSLEVSQIARSISRFLAVDEDLTETLALAHDLGHTPFGHAGEEALNKVAADIGGFDHNAHTLRIVTKLEHRYGGFDGLNLTWESLEGLVKHNGPLGGSLPLPIISFDARWPLELKTWPGIEAQIASLADDIAYVSHDIDDGLRAGILPIEELRQAPLAGPILAETTARWGDIELGRLIGEFVRKLIGVLVGDILTETQKRLRQADPQCAADVRNRKTALVAFSPDMASELLILKKFLFARVYRHPRVTASMERAKGVVTDLYGALVSEPALLPPDWTDRCGEPGDARTGGVVRDYLAGMTDRFALSEYRRIFSTEIAL